MKGEEPRGESNAGNGKVQVVGGAAKLRKRGGNGAKPSHET